MESTLVRSASRLEAYSDALFSIVATVMIVPIAHTDIPKDEVIRPHFWSMLAPQLIVYAVTFLLICDTWGKHVWIFEAINRVDELTVLLNLALMMIVTFYPYTFTLLGAFPTEPLAILLFAAITVLVNLLQCVFIVHAFRHPDMLSRRLQEGENSLRSQRNSMLAAALTPVVLAGLAAIATQVWTPLAGFLLLMIVFGNFIRRNTIKMYKTILSCCRAPAHFELSIEDEPSAQEKLVTETVSKERTECFSDGVFAIVATLIILDICEKSIPSKKDMDEAGSLVRALSPESSVFLAYAGTFVSVGLLWYVHHSLLHYIKELNILMSVLNNLSLLSVGYLPLAFMFVTTYNVPAHRIYANETLAIQLNCVILFFAGMCQSMLYVVALWNQEKRVFPIGHFGTAEHNYMAAKLCVLPIVSLVVYLLSLGGDHNVETSAFNGMQIGVLGLFVLLQLVYSIHKRRKEIMISGINDDFVNISI